MDANNRSKGWDALNSSLEAQPRARMVLNIGMTMTNLSVDNLYNYLLKASGRDLIITFDDGDRYRLADIDLCFGIARDGSREDEPLDVLFEDCRDCSNKRQQAIRDGRLKTRGVGWTSTEPTEPISMTYDVANICSVWDDEKQYFVFERNIQNS